MNTRAMLGGATATVMIVGAIAASVRTHDLAGDKSRLEHSLSAYELSALQAARSYATTFATYRYDDLDADFAATEAHSVDPFLSQYRSTTGQLRDTLTKARATSSAKIISAGLAAISSGQAVVDLFLDRVKEGHVSIAESGKLFETFRTVGVDSVRVLFAREMEGALRKLLASGKLASLSARAKRKKR